MADQLAYVIITPHSLHKSRTGGILARLLTRTGLDLVAARMFSPGGELVSAYSEKIVSSADPQDRRIQELIRDYILRNLSPDLRTGKRRRVMMLVFRGEDAVRKVRTVVGNIRFGQPGGETIRDTYGDLVVEESGRVSYFEPAVLAAPNAEEATDKLKLWAKFSDSDGGLLENIAPVSESVPNQRTLVLIKPDNFRFPTGRPGNVIDFFSRTGLFIAAIQVHRMSVAEAVEFYGPVIPTLHRHYKGIAETKASPLIEKELGCALPEGVRQSLGELLGPIAGDNQFNNLVRFMAGHAPHELATARHGEPGTEKCIALVYEGPEAVRKIREVLGPTDPSKAPTGTIRREFGQTVMINAAHASDSPDNAEREIAIIKPGANRLKALAGF